MVNEDIALNGNALPMVNLWHCPVCRRILRKNDKNFAFNPIIFHTPQVNKNIFLWDSLLFDCYPDIFCLIRGSWNDFFEDDIILTEWQNMFWVMVTKISPSLHSVELIWQGPPFFKTVISSNEAHYVAQQCREHKEYKPEVWMKGYIREYCNECAQNQEVNDE